MSLFLDCEAGVLCEEMLLNQTKSREEKGKNQCKVYKGKLKGNENLTMEPETIRVNSSKQAEDLQLHCPLLSTNIGFVGVSTIGNYPSSCHGATIPKVSQYSTNWANIQTGRRKTTDLAHNNFNRSTISQGKQETVTVQVLLQS